MDLAFKYLLFIFLICTVLMLIFDVQRTGNNVQDQFETMRSGNQNGLQELLPKINEYEIITNGMMLETWISNFLGYNNITFEETQIDFVLMNTEPQLYLVKLKGFNDYVIIDQQAYNEFISGSVVIEVE